MNRAAQLRWQPHRFVQLRWRTPAWSLVCIVFGGPNGIQTTQMPFGTPIQDSLVIRRVFRLSRGEGVFAYARIAPSGDYLVYAAETRTSKRPQIEKLVNLRTGRVVWDGPGIDGYWSPDGDRFVYERLGPRPTVDIRYVTGRTIENVFPAALGDYFSWGRDGDRDVILTILGNYTYMHGDAAIPPTRTTPSCPRIGMGQRPLISKDGKRASVFVDGTLVVRDIEDCNNLILTNVEGAKADFSWDGRYIAFHTLKPDESGYDIGIVDLRARTIRYIRLSGSSLFPSWTKDGRLCFRYDADDYQGFLIASGFLSLPAKPLPGAPKSPPDSLSLTEVFPESRSNSLAKTAVVVAWAPWSAHTPQTLAGLDSARTILNGSKEQVYFLAAVDPATSASDAARYTRVFAPNISTTVIPAGHVTWTALSNQNPAYMLFRNGWLVGRRLGAMSTDQIVEWTRPYLDLHQ